MPSSFWDDPELLAQMERDAKLTDEEEAEKDASFERLLDAANAEAASAHE